MTPTVRDFPSGKCSILVLGASGKQGGAVARVLAGVGFRVRGATRDRRSVGAERLKQHEIEPVEVDLANSESIEAALRGMQALYVVLPFFPENQEREIEQGHAVINAAVEAGVGHVIYSAGARSNERTGVPHLDSKGEIERHLRVSGLRYTVLRPVAFNYSLEAYRESVVEGFLPDPRASGSLVAQLSEYDQGCFAALVLLDPGNWAGVAIETASDVHTVLELAEIFGRVSGRQVVHKQISWEEEERAAGAEVVRLARWVEAEGPRVNVQTLRRRFPWLTRTEDYLIETGWFNR